MAELAGIDVPAVSRWLLRHIPDAREPFSFRFIVGGRSNLTYAVEDGAGHRWALRRPPTGSVLATAHDMTREWRLIEALHPAGVPVATPVALCTDDEVTGAPFYVMGFVDGVVLTDEAAATQLEPAARARTGPALVDVLAELHALDPVAVGLDSLAGNGNYVARQLKRWLRQVRAIGPRELEVFETVHDLLAADIPEAPRCVVHGDFRAGNACFTATGEVAAVFDWELATLGDPLADLGWLVGSWSQPGDELPALTPNPSGAQGFSTRAELIDRYARKSGRDVSTMDYYLAFNRWRAACIGAGVVARYRDGVMGADVDAAQVASREMAVEQQLRIAERTLRALT